MAPPLFLDLGKSASYVFNRGYIFDSIEVYTTARRGDVDFVTNAILNMYGRKLWGKAAVTYKIPDKGITLIERCNMDTLFGTEVIMEDRLIKGLKLGLTVESLYTPVFSKKSAKVMSEFKHDYVSLNSDLEINSTGGPIFNAAGVVGCRKNWFVGYQTAFDIAQSKITQSNFSLAFDKGDFVLHALIKNAKEFGGSVYHRVHKDLELAVNMNWKINEQEPRFDVGAIYNINTDTVIRSKINSDSQLCLSLIRQLRPRLWINVAALLNLPTLTSGGHKCGLYLYYEWPQK